MSTFKQQWHVLAILFSAWGVIGLARNAITYLFPYLQLEFGLGSGHMGFLSATLAIFWAVSMMLSGKFYNRLGAKKIMLPGLIVTAVGTGIMGLTTHVAFLYVCVALAGFGAGSICTPSFSMLSQYTDPRKRGMFMGVMQSAFQLIGVAGGSIVLAYLGNRFGWRGSYQAVGVVFLLFAVAFGFCLRYLSKSAPQNTVAPKKAVAEKVVPAPASEEGVREIFRSKNMKIAALATCFCTIWSFTVTAYTILYLIEARGFSMVTAGIVFSGFGLGGFLGNVLGTTLSDFLGRKPAILVCCLCNVAFFMTFLSVDAAPSALAVLLFFSAFFYSGMSPIVITIIPSEAVHQRLIAKATSFTPSIGEVFGGILAPVLVGICLSYLPIASIMGVLSFMPLLVFGLCLFLEETAPRALERQKNARRKGRLESV